MDSTEAAEASFDAVRSWVEAELDASVIEMERQAGGGSREAWAVTVKGSGGETRSVFVRRDSGVGPVSGSDLTLAREAAVARAVAARGIPAAPIIAVDDERDVVLADFVQGAGSPEDLSGLIGDDCQQPVIDSFVDTMAKVHSLDVSDLAGDLPTIPIPASAPEHATLEVDFWQQLYEEKATLPDPVVVAAFNWLRHNAPEAVERTVLVHGDCGPGNFLYDRERAEVVALLDWEFAHFGDPMDDLAWWAFRDNGTFPDYDASLKRWSDRTGLAVNRESLSYYGLLILVRVAVCSVRGLANAGAAIDNSVWHVLMPMMRRSIADLLADLMGVEHSDFVDDVEQAAPTDVDAVIATLGRDLQTTLMPDLRNPDALKRAAGMSMLVAFLQQSHRMEAGINRGNLADLCEVLPRQPETVDDGLRALETEIRQAGEVSPAVLRILCRVAERSQLPWSRLGIGWASGTLSYPPAYAPRTRRA